MLVCVGHTTWAVADGASILVGGSLDSFKESHPHLKDARFTLREWRGTLKIPLFGERAIVLPYFEADRTPQEMSTNPTQNLYARTTVAFHGDQRLGVVVVISKNPPHPPAVLADEAVNALLPQWLFERGVDIWEILQKNATDPYRFTWDGKSWVFNQLSEAFSFTVSGQMMPGGYTGEAKKLCDDLPPYVSDTYKKYNAYELTNYLAQKTGCDFSRMHALLEGAAKVAIDAFPKRTP